MNFDIKQITMAKSGKVIGPNIKGQTAITAKYAPENHGSES